MEKYIINNDTTIIMPINDIKSKVYENHISFDIDKSVNEIVDESCKYYGSSLKGRIDASYYLIGVKYKCPIIVSENMKIVFFPTTSYKDKKCCWINYNSIDKYYSNNNNITILLLKNTIEYELDISLNVLSNQIFKSSRLESIIKSKNK